MPVGDKILIIGNGFDIAHGLPTTYADFLAFGECFVNLFTFTKGEETFNAAFLDPRVRNQHIKEQLLQLFSDRVPGHANGVPFTYKDEELKTLYSLLKNNVWFDYFQRLSNEGTFGVNWIDFEAEISEIVQWIDTNNSGMASPYFALHERMKSGDGKLIIFYQCSETWYFHATPNTVEDFVEKLYEHLDRLTKALNIYLYRFVEPLLELVNPLDVISQIKPARVVSFNYTHTFSRIYDSEGKAQVCYIHGDCGPERNNMVLGIDEYQDDLDRDSNNDMAIFRKFVQRIRKNNDVSYSTWQQKNEEAFAPYRNSGRDLSQYMSDVYIYGHSLDVTDKDILDILLRPDFVRLHLFAYNEVDEGRKFPNLIRILGEKELIARSTVDPQKIETIIVGSGGT